MAYKPNTLAYTALNPSAFDYTTGDFTKDAAWHELDLSAKVPAGTKLINIKQLFTATGVGKQFTMRTNGVTYAYDTYGILVAVANVQHEANIIIPVSSDRKVDYYLPSTGVTLANIVIQGYFS